MPPPKKPKNGPTSEEQFLSQEELQLLKSVNNRGKSKHGPSDPTSTPGEPSAAPPEDAPSRASSSLPTPTSQHSPHDKTGGVTLHSQLPKDGGGNSSSSRSDPPAPPRKSSPAGVTKTQLGKGPTPETPSDRRGGASISTSMSSPPPPLSDLGRDSSQTVPHTSIKDNGKLHAPAVRSGTSSSSLPPVRGSMIDKLFSSRATELLHGDGSFSEHQLQQQQQHQQQHTWPSGLPPVAVAAIRPPQVFPADSRHGLGYSSSTLASLMTRPGWLTPQFESQRHLVAHAAAAAAASRGHHLERMAEQHSLQSAAASSFSGVQQEQQQHKSDPQHQQQQLTSPLSQQQHHHSSPVNRRSILASLFIPQLPPGTTSSPPDDLTSPQSSDDVFLMLSSSTHRGGPAAPNPYLNSLVRQQQQQQQSARLQQVTSAASRGPSVGRPSSSGHRTESAPVYLHPAFQLPPCTTSGIRKNNSTSSLSLISSVSPRGPSCLMSLPPTASNATSSHYPVRTSPIKQPQGHGIIPALLQGTIANLSSQYIINNNNNDNGNNGVSTKHPESSPLAEYKPGTSSPGSSAASYSYSAVINNNTKRLLDDKSPQGHTQEPFDLSVKNKPATSGSASKDHDKNRDVKDDVDYCPPVKTRSIVLSALMSNTQPVYPTLPIRPSSSTSSKMQDSVAGAAESDDSNDFINVTSPEPPSTTASLQRAPSETLTGSPSSPSSFSGAFPRSSAAGDRTSSSSPASSIVAGVTRSRGLMRSISETHSAMGSPSMPATTRIKEELVSGGSNVPYTSSSSPLAQCKTERHSSGSDTASREPSDIKSPKQEGRMVSPTNCMPVLPLGAGGESGAAHRQAATSTTPEAGSGPMPHNFLMDVQGLATPSPPSHMKQEIGGAVPGSSMQAKLCQVCNDNASGFHYGVWSCEGCKAFFKRSIQGPVDYICPATNTCTIDKHRRKSCQACRLRRCYEVGMNKGSQRKERKSSGNTNLKGKRYRADSSDSTINSTNNGASSSKVAKRSRSASILEALQKADLPVLDSHHNHNLPASRIHLLNTLIKLADRELVYLINWAKHVPGYTCLTLSDQVHLIECCWMELLLLNCAFRSMEHKGRTLVFAPDFHLERQQWAVTGMEDVLEQVSAVSEQMLLYGLNKEELLLLQATVLVNAEVRRLDSFVKIQEMRQTILDVFMEVAGRHQGYSNWRHAPSILLLLTHVRQAGERGITYFQRLKMEGSVNFCDLLTEMLDAHNSSGERRRLQQQQQQQQQLLQHHQHQHPPPPPQGLTDASAGQHQQQQGMHPSQQHSHQGHPQHPGSQSMALVE